MNLHAALADVFLFAHNANPMIKKGDPACPPAPAEGQLVPLPNCPAGTPKPEAIIPADTIAYVLADLAIILIAARIVGGIFVRLKQPRVVGEIIAGILIGPTILGGHLSRGDVTSTPKSEAIAGHGATNDLYPLQAFAFLNLIGALTLVFFMFLVGLEVQQRFLKGREKQIAVVALAVLVVPVGLGFLVAGVLDGPEWKPAAIDSGTHGLILGAAIAVTAFPVMARILQEKRMIATDMGATGVGAAAVVTPLMFLVLAGAAASAKGSGVPGTVAVKFAYAIGLVVVLFVLVRPFLKNVVLKKFDPEKPLPGDVLALMLFGALASGLAADRIGIHSLNGGFLFGACVPQLPGLAKAVIDRLGDFVILFLIPIFLAVAGIQTDFTVLTGDLIPGILLFLAAMVVGKWVVGALAGRAVGLNWREANTIGVLMNCRGLMILVVAIVAGSFGGITPEMRVVFALGAIITTLMTGPLVDVFLPKEDVEAEREKSVGGSIAALPSMTGGPRVLLVPGEPAYVAAVGERAQEFLEREGQRPQFLAVDLPAVSEHGDYVGAGVELAEQDRTASVALGWLAPLTGRLQAGDADADAVSFVTPDPEGDLARLATDWAATHAIVALDEHAEVLERAGIDVHRTKSLVLAPLDPALASHARGLSKDVLTAILAVLMADPFIKQYLMTAGPTPIPPAVSNAMAEPIPYHRAPEFVELYARCLDRLENVFQTTGDVLVFASSGSGGMESAAANLVRPGEKALVARCGKFGERWAELVQAYGGELVDLDVEWGRKVEPAELERALAEAGEVPVVFTTLSETSTGVVNDIHALTDVAHAHGALIAVDAVSGLGAVPCPMDEWGVDAVVSGSQKALMCPPGLGFAAVGDAALARAEESPGRRYYFDWGRTAKGQRKDPPDSPFTPAVTLFQGLDAALRMIEEEGLDQVFARHALLGRATREAAKALDLELFGPEDEGANVVTAIKVPDGVDGGKVPKLMRDKYGVTIAGGQNQLKGKIVRIAHCGYFGAFDIVTTIAGLEMTLRELGHEHELGAGVGAAQRVFLEAGVPAAAPA